MFLKPLDEQALISLLQQAINNDGQIKEHSVHLKETNALLNISGGDARKLLNLFELVVTSANSKEIMITDELVMKVAQKKIALYDKQGEQHYDIISAFIKSMRGSDPNAAVYWLARMIAGGEDVKFIARRMVIFASEDIGNANPNALLLANATFDAVNKIGYPESRIILSQCAVYLASSSIKSNASYEAIGKALEAVNDMATFRFLYTFAMLQPGLMKDLDYGKGYKYAHSFEGNFTEQEFLPEKLSSTAFYEPGKNATGR